jgi:hypothetical protein
MLNAPIAAPARYVAFPFMICAPLKIPLKSFIPNTIAITDEPVETIPSSNIRNKKNTYLLNFSMASMGPIILKPKGFPGTRRKNAMPEIKASIPIVYIIQALRKCSAIKSRIYKIYIKFKKLNCCIKLKI